MSAESGISTFRDSDGLWEKYRVEDVATPEGFARDPDLVQAFYNARRRQLRAANYLRQILRHRRRSTADKSYPEG